MSVAGGLISMLLNKYMFPAIFLFAAFVMLGLSAYFKIDAQEFLDNSEKTSAKVVRLRSSPTDLMSKAPVIQFKTSSGKKITYETNVYSRPPDYEVGDIVTVFYISGDGKVRAKIDGFFSLWGVQVILFIIGSTFALLGAVSAWSIRSN